MLKSAALSICELELLEHIAAKQDAAAPGVRLSNDADLTQLLSQQGTAAKTARSLLKDSVHPVRAVLFDKSPDKNWSLGWHQDRTIVVKKRIETECFGPWSVKRGLHHVEPPFEIFSSMVTLRIHLDDVDKNNAPLLIAAGSHVHKKVQIEKIEQVVSEHEVHSCLASRGDIWAYKTPIIHASEASASNKSRRVLQVDFCNHHLPNGLQWYGV